MSAAVANLVESEAERNLFVSERDAFLQGLVIPEPDEFYYNLKPVNVERAVALLESWCNEDDSDEPQAETIAYLKRVLDEDRLSDRKLFP